MNIDEKLINRACVKCKFFTRRYFITPACTNPEVTVRGVDPVSGKILHDFIACHHERSWKNNGICGYDGEHWEPRLLK